MGKKLWRVPEWGFVLTLAFYCFEKFIPGVYPKKWPVMPWGWLTISLLLLWLGFQLQRLADGNHWLQHWWKQRAKFAVFSGVQYRNLLHGYECYVKVIYSRSISNVRVNLDMFELIHLANGTAIWRRLYGGKSQRANLNPGDTEEILVARAVQQAALGPPTPLNLKDKDGFFRTRLSVSASGRAATVIYSDFWVNADGVHSLPMAAPEAGLGADLAAMTTFEVPHG